jgi:hypothetical protein
MKRARIGAALAVGGLTAMLSGAPRRFSLGETLRLRDSRSRPGTRRRNSTRRSTSIFKAGVEQASPSTPPKKSHFMPNITAKLLAATVTCALLNVFPAAAQQQGPSRIAFASRPILRHKAMNCAQTFLMAGPLSLRKSAICFVIRNEPSRQPHHFQIAASLTLEPPARLDPVEIAIDIKLERRQRMISRPAGRCRGDAIEPQLAQFQRIDEHIDRPNRIALVQGAAAP